MASSPDLKDDYRQGRLGGFTSPFYPALHWPDIASARAQHPTDRGLLQRVLQRQYQGIKMPPAAAENLAALHKPTTFCITTGQQPALAGGPLYTLLKAVTAVQLAQQAQQQLGPGHRVVPLFWMASEDHDAPEVNHAWLGWDQRVHYPGTFAGAVGRHTLTQAVRGLLPQRSAAAAAFRPGVQWARAFSHWLHSLLGQHGLLVLDPDDALLKQAFLPLGLRELTRPFAQAAMQATTVRLEEMGFRAQLHPRPINLFYLTDDARIRLEAGPGGYQLAEPPHTQWSATELTESLTQHPERLSPNAVLRPLYQEMVVPSLAYVGGWAEVAYWLQLKDVFAAAGVFLPPVVPRSQALIVPHAQAQAWQALGLAPEQWLLPRHELVCLLVRRHWQDAEIKTALHQLQEKWEQLASLTEALDQGQYRNVRGAQTRSSQWIDRFYDRMLKQLARQHPEWVEPALTLQAAVQPPGWQQERTLAAAAITPHEAHLAEWLLRHLQPQAAGVQVLTYPGPHA